MGVIKLNGKEYGGGGGGVIYLPTIYSEEEREVGVWRDGKPLYQKTLVINNLNLNTSGTAVDITSLGVDMCCPVYDGSYYIVSGVIRGFARLEYQQPNEVYLYPAVNRTGTTSFITLQYTKTTDTAGSGTWTPSGELAHHYSTNEQVIGTWIDGKPIYERTWDFSDSPVMLSYADWVDSGIPASENIKSIISAELKYGAVVLASVEVGVNVDGHHIGFQKLDNLNTRGVSYCTLRYTKTTD